MADRIDEIRALLASPRPFEEPKAAIRYLLSEVDRLTSVAFGTAGEPRTPEDYAEREQAITDVVDQCRRVGAADERAAIVAWLRGWNERTGGAESPAGLAYEIEGGAHIAAPEVPDAAR